MDTSPPHPPPYVTAALRTRVALEDAMAQAQRLLPHATRTHHYIAGAYSPTAWRAAESHYRAQTDPDPVVLQVLTDLALMAEALSALLSITTAREDQRPRGSLKLARRRHSAL
jgi:hypothetical protein